MYKSIKIALFFIHGYTLHRRATAVLLFVLSLFPLFFFNEFHVDAMIKSCCRANETFYPIREIWKIFINVGATKREKFISYSSFRHVASNNNQEMTRTGTSANKYTGWARIYFPIYLGRPECAVIYYATRTSHDIHRHFRAMHDGATLSFIDNVSL